MIQFHEVSKIFGDSSAVDKLSFTINDGEFVFFIGASGAGKTSIVKLLLHQYTPTSGEIVVDDFNYNKLNGRQLLLLRRSIGVVFQDFKLVADKTVKENIMLPLVIANNDDENADKNIQEALNLVGLPDKAQSFPSQLAGGEIQRVCLARAIIGNPKIIVADEPTGNLDPHTAKQIAELLKQINKMGKTVLMMTHNHDIVDSMEERVIELDKGKVVSDKKKAKYKKR
jgi:cell division transport system ATP-binding protein